MEDNWNLSDKSTKVDKNLMFFDTDVKEFIKRLKEELKSGIDGNCPIICPCVIEKIDKLAGEKLTSWQETT